MTQTAIQEQIQAIREASANARKSPEAARQFLIDAGILKETPKKDAKSEAKTKK